MRRITLASFVSIAFVCQLAGGIASAETSITPTVDATLIAIAAERSLVAAEHPLVGEWMLTTADGSVPAVFGADGSAVLKFPSSVIGNEGFAFVNTAFGTWEPIGARGASFTAVQNISHANGVYLGTATIDGYLTMSDDPSLTNVVASLTSITVRDSRNNIAWVADVDAAQAAMSATRTIEAAPVAAGAVARALDPDAILGNGGRTCTTCAVLFAPRAEPAASAPGPFEAHGANLSRSAVTVSTGVAEARYVRAKYAALEPVAAEPAAARYGGGCNTCR